LLGNKEEQCEKRNSMKRVLILMTGLALGLAACGSDDGGTDTTGGGGGAEERVEIVGLAFSPETLTVPAGTTVTWVNSDSVSHTATSDDDVWDSDTLASDGEFSFTLDEAGTFSYFCKIHPSMTGSIVVEG
jgi:plastocyanin